MQGYLWTTPNIVPGLIISPGLRGKMPSAINYEAFPLNMQKLRFIVSSLNVLMFGKVQMGFSGFSPARDLFLLLVR